LKALTLTAAGGLDNLLLQNVPDPDLVAPDDVRVRIHAASLNRLDLFVVAGLPGVKYSFPHIMGTDGAGTVAATGPAATRFRHGDRVMINSGISCGHCEWCEAGEEPLCLTYSVLGEHRHGTLAEFVVVPERNLAPVPAEMPMTLAAAFSLVTLTAWRMLVHRAALQPGETVLIWGIGGGVAVAALKIAKLLGASVVVTSSSDAKLERARELGADVVLNHAKTDVPKEIRSLTSKRGVEVVVDNVGEQTWEKSLRCLARKGRLVTCGATTGPMCVTDVRKLFWYQWSILGSTMGSHEEYRAVTEEAARGRLWPEVDTVVPLGEARRAFERLERAEQLGKIVIEVTG
jgi:NADPH:quinone reductase-like Zn-dependent oxidoreductase